MEQLDLLIHAARAVVNGQEQAASIGILGGRIAQVGDAKLTAPATETLELGPDVVLLPGLVDSHVHICEPGNTEWEGFATATRAAAAGGITTLVDMPLDSVPTTVTVGALEEKRQAASGVCAVDVGFWGGVVPWNLGELGALHEAGVLGFKCFLADSGSDDFPPLDLGQLELALRVLYPLDEPLLVHAESAEAAAAIPPASGRSYAAYLASRPRGIENLAVAQLIEAARRTDGRVHVLHLSSSDALPMIASAKADGLRLTSESCPHYLTLAAEEIGDGETAFKCSPPIRESANRDLLWEGLAQGTLDLIVSDHSPCTPEMKEIASGDFGPAWGGVSSLQVALPAVWTEARRRGMALARVVGWMAERPAQLARLATKGRIAPGCDADFAVFAPEETFVVDGVRLEHRHPVTPYQGRTLHGVVRQTILRGRRVDFGDPHGRLLTRAISDVDEPGRSTAAAQ